MATIPVTRRFGLTDGQWAVLEPLLPRGKKPGGSTSGDTLWSVASTGSNVTCGVATRYDKLVARYQATLHIAAINEWL